MEQEALFKSLEVVIRELRVEIKELKASYERVILLEERMGHLAEKLESIEKRLDRQVEKATSVSWEFLKLLLGFLLGIISAFVIKQF